jgi:hypothetical protein
MPARPLRRRAASARRRSWLSPVQCSRGKTAGHVSVGRADHGSAQLQLDGNIRAASVDLQLSKQGNERRSHSLTSSCDLYRHRSAVSGALWLEKCHFVSTEPLLPEGRERIGKRALACSELRMRVRRQRPWCGCGRRRERSASRRCRAG